MRGIIDGRGRIPGGICHRQRAPGLVCHRGGRVAASVRSGVNHSVCRITAGRGGRYPGMICLRERKPIHRHRFGGDVAGRQGVVALAFRSNMILYPLRRSQVSFVYCQGKRISMSGFLIDFPLFRFLCRMH